MTPKLAHAAAANRRALVEQLYDDWRGYYLLHQLICGAWCDVRELSRAEALTWRCKADEALEIVWKVESMR